MEHLARFFGHRIMYKCLNSFGYLNIYHRRNKMLKHDATNSTNDPRHVTGKLPSESFVLRHWRRRRPRVPLSSWGRRRGVLPCDMVLSENLSPPGLGGDDALRHCPAGGVVTELRCPRVWHSVYRLSGVLVWLRSRVVFSPFGVFSVTSVVLFSWDLLCKRATSLPCIVRSWWLYL
jgi:hypothetical protein